MTRLRPSPYAPAYQPLRSHYVDDVATARDAPRCVWQWRAISRYMGAIRGFMTGFWQGFAYLNRSYNNGGQILSNHGPATAR